MQLQQSSYQVLSNHDTYYVLEWTIPNRNKSVWYSSIQNLSLYCIQKCGNRRIDLLLTENLNLFMS